MAPHAPMQTRVRLGFSLVEMLVVMALLLLMLSVLAEVFSIGMKSLQTARAVGGLQANLRSAATIIRRDLMADHFGGRRRLSDYDPKSYSPLPPSREGFFRVYQAGDPVGDANEGADPDGLPSRRRTGHILHFAVKLRGNAPEQFFQASLPPGSPLAGLPTTFFDQPADARFQGNGQEYRSAWGEVAYYLQPSNSPSGALPLYTLYRTQLVGAPDTRGINWTAGNQVPVANLPAYAGISCVPDSANQWLRFLTPVDWAQKTRAFTQATRPGNVVLTDVISFDVQAITMNLGNQSSDSDFIDVGDYDSSNSPNPMRSLRIIIRAWDLKTQLSRQITIIQDL